MKSERRKRIMTLSIIAVGVLALSIGFAAYTATLNIKSSATVTPDASNFSVIFSNDGTSTATQQTVSPSLATYGEAATIKNEGNPTISGLNAKFTAPNQSVTYTFYAKNTGSYDAYLNYILFNGSKECTPEEGTDKTMVDNACNGIELSIKVGNEEPVTTSQEGIQNHVLGKGLTEQVIVTITYKEDSAIADGGFSVSFGDISLIYSTVNNYELPKACTLADTDNDDIADVGEVVTCVLGESTDNFYVIEETPLSSESVQVLTEMNINTTTYRQSENAGTVSFSSTNYWSEETNYPVEVYDNRNDGVKPIVDEYVKYLDVTLETVTGSLLTNEQANNLKTNHGNPSWYRIANFWTATAITYDAILSVDRGGHITGDVTFENNQYVGVRPVITIETTDIG